MHAAIDGQQLVLTFTMLEAAVLKRILTGLSRDYATPPEQLDPALAAAWYPRRVCETAKMSAEQIREWLQALHQYKSSTLQQLRNWCEALSLRKRGHCRLSLDPADAPVFMRVLNDHRLGVAARHKIAEAEMQLQSPEALEKLDQDRQQAVFEIHLLAWIIEEILRLLAPEAAHWMD